MIGLFDLTLRAAGSGKDCSRRRAGAVIVTADQASQPASPCAAVHSG